MATYTRDEGYFPEDLLQSSLDHYEAAKKLLNDAPALFDSGGYILHLAIELIFKSWILQLSNEFDGTHSLQSLRNTLIESGISLPFTKKENNLFEHLDRLYELRYPNRASPTEIGTEELELVETIVEKMWQGLPDELYEAYQNIPANSKGGRKLMARPRKLPIDVKLLTGK